jgi:hypothetical protein
MNAPANTAPLTFDDVAQALGDSDPSSTNASKLRAILGRGSFGTIQKHLDTIRAQRAKASQPAEVTKTPDAPPELLSMWGAAVAVAVAQVRTRLDGVVQERDSLAQALASARGDVEALAGELEGATVRAEAAATDMAQQVAQLQAEAAQHAQALQAQEQAAAALQAKLSQQVAEGLQQVQVSELQARLGAQALQTTIDRLTDQVGELKSLLALQARPNA